MHIICTKKIHTICMKNTISFFYKKIKHQITLNNFFTIFNNHKSAIC